jgi:hypothetical protein
MEKGLQLRNYFGMLKRLAVSGADERLLADLLGPSKMYFIEELSEILHVFRDTPRKTPFDEESQYKTDFPD